MDLPLLATPASEYSEQRTGACFTVRSASSSSYSLNRRPGIRKPRFVPEGNRENAEKCGEREGYGTSVGPNGTTAKEDQTISGYQTKAVKCQYGERDTASYKMSAAPNQNDTAEKTTPEFGSGRSGNPAFVTCGRADLRGESLVSRSKSLDWRTVDRLSASTKRIGDICEQAGGLNEKSMGFKSVRARVVLNTQHNPADTSSDVREKSPVSPLGETLNRASRGHSLPIKLRSESGSSSGARGQSILERIEKLYGSHYKETAAEPLNPPKQRSNERASGGTFPRCFSSGEGSTFSPVQSTKPLNWSQKDTFGPETTLPETKRTKERMSGGLWQGQIPERYPEDGVVSSGGDLDYSGTMSLDRSRSRCTLAAQIRSARAAEGITTAPQSNAFSKEEGSGSLRDSSGLRERRASGSNYQGRLDHGEEKSPISGLNGTWRDRTGWPQEHEREKDKAKYTLKGGLSDEDVFMSNLQESTTETTEKKSLPSAASVRNKISQFEALTQRFQGLATGHTAMPRRALSVPAQLSRVRDGGKISGSTKVLRPKEEGEDGEKTEEKERGAGLKLGSERSLSVDEVGLRLGWQEKEVNDLLENEGKKESEDFDKYSRLKSTLHISLDGEAQRQRRNYDIDETDFSKVSSPNDKASEGPPLSQASISIDTSAGVEKNTLGPVISPDRDEDKTPTNTPVDSPFVWPSTRLENATPIAETIRDVDSVFVQAAKTPEANFSPLSCPLATSSSGNLADILCPDVHAVHATGKKQLFDMDAWVAGLKPRMKAWNDEEYYYDDDDDDGTQKDEDSNYDSDSGESSVTITSNMSQSDRKSFCVSLSDLCNFAGVDYESENDSDEWLSSNRRTASLSSDMSALSYVSVLPAEELDRLLEDVRSLGDNALQDYNDVQVVVLHKEVAVGLGFSLAGGVDQNKPITVHRVFHSGVAAREGSIREGDQVLSINGTALCGYAHWEALRVLRRAKTRDMGVVVVRRGGLSIICKGGAKTTNQGSTQTQITETGQLVCVRLEKNSRDLGFSLEGGVGSSLENKPLTVQKIFQGGPADKVFPGDEVVEIESVNVEGMRRLEAWTLIRKLPQGPVDVVLRRTPGRLNT